MREVLLFGDDLPAENYAQIICLFVCLFVIIVVVVVLLLLCCVVVVVVNDCVH